MKGKTTTQRYVHVADGFKVDSSDDYGVLRACEHLFPLAVLHRK